jgi:hypothetical protein
MMILLSNQQCYLLLWRGNKFLTTRLNKSIITYIPILLLNSSITTHVSLGLPLIHYYLLSKLYHIYIQYCLHRTLYIIVGIPSLREHDIATTILQWCLLEWSLVWLGSRHLVLQLLGTLTDFFRDSKQGTYCVKKMY